MITNPENLLLISAALESDIPYTFSFSPENPLSTAIQSKIDSCIRLKAEAILFERP